MRGGTLDPIHIMAVEHVPSFKFLGTRILEDLPWTTNTSSLIKKSHQRLFFLWTLTKNHLSSAVLVNFCHCDRKHLNSDSLNGPIISRDTGRCLEVEMSKDANFGLRLVVQRCSGQKWMIRNWVKHPRH
ncbi:Polypeptide N-acetylgalactosaminyltransferase 9 [Takifugu flavidus]|uniref:Polypeptide N-acetylgalactosaminyltransferase 9 n=1 Tax=Takifugu flavidus TaxID=433684 RepID=A0A5C6N0G8_9TELE|nr:Polypeptide N-acetylgalactosaminyltransferase 9 [Takifugu flavidus]